MSYRALAILLLSAVVTMTLPAAAAGSNATKVSIARAMTSAPASVTANATFINMDAKGTVTVLKKGTNGFTCYGGHKGVPTDDPWCADAAGMQWVNDWMAHKPKPSNTGPGLIYMLAGAEDWSASDPWATKGTLIHETGHYMIMWPYAKSSGLDTKFKNTGTWLMWAGTPYAHLMVQGKP